MTLLPSQWHSHHEALEGPKDRGLGPALGAQLPGGDTWGGRHPPPQFRELLPAGACGCWTAWSDIAHPNSQALCASTPLWPFLAPCQWACHRKCPWGCGARRGHQGLQASWYLLENCLTVPPLDKAPPIGPAPAPLSPVLWEALPPPLLEGWGTFLPKQSTDKASGCHACFQLWVTKPCPQDRGGTGRPQALLSPHSPFRTRLPPGHIPHHVQCPPLSGMQRISS